MVLSRLSWISLGLAISDELRNLRVFCLNTVSAYAYTSSQVLILWGLKVWPNGNGVGSWLHMLASLKNSFIRLDNDMSSDEGTSATPLQKGIHGPSSTRRYLFCSLCKPILKKVPMFS
eukprot:XP_015581629.1 uncharacterized protein LOC107262150 [Ricinus communis]